MKHIVKLARKYGPSAVIGAVLVSPAGAAEALPSAYTTISTDATATFGWAKEFAIGVIVFGFVASLVKLAKRR